MTPSIEQILEDVLSNKTTKRYLLSESFFMFIRLYLNSYFRLGIPPFQEDMIRNLENRKIRGLLITSFIGGGKTTIASIAYLLWEAFRTSEKKVIVHVSRTRDEAQELALRIQHEILWNDALIETYGEPNRKLMTRRRIELPKVNTVLFFTHLHDEQFNYESAKVIIIDSPFSETNRLNTKEEEVTLLEKIMDVTTYERIVIASSVYHREGVMAKLLLQKIPFKKLSYPIVDTNGQILWERKYAQKDIDRLKEVTEESKWHKSYLLDLRGRRYMHYWMAECGDNFAKFKDAKEKKSYHAKYYRNVLYFEKDIILGKFNFTSPKFGMKHIFLKKGEELPPKHNWFD